MRQLWIFDLDGTLTDSFPLFTSSVEAIFRAHGLTFTDDHLREILGMDARPFFAKYLGAERSVWASEELFRLSMEGAARIPVYEGIERVLTSLRAAKREISVWTGRDLRSAREVLKATGLDAYVDHCVSGSCVSVNKPNPEGASQVLSRHGRGAHEGVMIGDHVHDMTAAKAIGLYGVRASWNGYWGVNPCDLADRQFHSVVDFASWVDEKLA